MDKLHCRYYVKNPLLATPESIIRIDGWLASEEWLGHHSPDPFVRFLEFGNASEDLYMREPNLVRASFYYSPLEGKARIFISPGREEGRGNVYGGDSVDLLLDELYHFLGNRPAEWREDLRAKILFGLKSHAEMVNAAVKSGVQIDGLLAVEAETLRDVLRRIEKIRKGYYPPHALPDESPWRSPCPSYDVMKHIEMGMGLPPSVFYKDTSKTYDILNGREVVKAKYGDDHPQKEIGENGVYLASLDFVVPANIRIDELLKREGNYWLRESSWFIPFSGGNPFDFEFPKHEHHVLLDVCRERESTYITVEAIPNHEGVWNRLRHIAQVVYSMEMSVGH